MPAVAGQRPRLFCVESRLLALARCNGTMFFLQRTGLTGFFQYLSLVCLLNLAIHMTQSGGLQNPLKIKGFLELMLSK